MRALLTLFHPINHDFVIINRMKERTARQRAEGGIRDQPNSATFHTTN